MKLKSLSLFLTASLFAFSLTACSDEPEQVALQGKTMGTTYHIKYIDNGEHSLPEPKQVQEELDNLLKSVNGAMSTYQKDSEISKFNQFKEVNTAFPISQDFAKVVKEAVRLNKVTEGALDVTVGPLINLWGFGPDKRLNKVPSQEQIAERAALVGIEKLKVLDDDGKTSLEKSVGGLYLDLSSTAKGFGVDKLADYFKKLGVQNYLVEIGGELRGEGKNIHNEAWQIAIEKPEYQQGVSAQVVVPLDDLGMATSGNYRNYFEDENGRRLSHIINPKTSAPIDHNLASITVLAKETMTADGLATGLFVLGPDEAMRVAEKEHLPIYMIIKDGDKYKTQMSSEFEKLEKLTQKK